MGLDGKDTMAQTAIKSPADVVDFLVSQHEQIKSLFAETLSAFVELRPCTNPPKRKSFTRGPNGGSPTELRRSTSD